MKYFAVIIKRICGYIYNSDVLIVLADLAFAIDVRVFMVKQSHPEVAIST